MKGHKRRMSDGENTWSSKKEKVSCHMRLLKFSSLTVHFVNKEMELRVKFRVGRKKRSTVKISVVVTLPSCSSS
jgi:hypothetical protein